MICPVCKEAGLTSTVIEIGTSSTCLGFCTTTTKPEFPILIIQTNILLTSAVVMDTTLLEFITCHVLVAERSMHQKRL